MDTVSVFNILNRSKNKVKRIKIHIMLNLKNKPSIYKSKSYLCFKMIYEQLKNDVFNLSNPSTKDVKSLKPVSKGNQYSILFNKLFQILEKDREFNGLFVKELDSPLFEKVYKFMLQVDEKEVFDTVNNGLKRLIKYNKVKEALSNYRQIKILAHSLGVSGEIQFDINGLKQEYQMAGFEIAFAFKELLKIFLEFKQSLEKNSSISQLEEHVLNQVESGLKLSVNYHTNFKNSQAIEKLKKASKVVPILFDRSYHGHCVTFTLYKNTLGLINRHHNEDKSEYNGCVLYNIKSPHKLSLKQLMEMNFGGKQSGGYLDRLDSMNRLYQRNAELLHKRLNLTQIKIIKHSKQKIGHCSWASVKTGLHLMLYQVFIDNLPKEKLARQSALKFYKAIIMYHRNFRLIHYLNHTSRLNTDLLKSIISQQYNIKKEGEVFRGIKIIQALEPEHLKSIDSSKKRDLFHLRHNYIPKHASQDGESQQDHYKRLLINEHERQHSKEIGFDQYIIIKRNSRELRAMTDYFKKDEDYDDYLKILHNNSGKINSTLTKKMLDPTWCLSTVKLKH